MLNDLKELERFLKLCRKQGVIEVTMDGISVKFGELPKKEAAQTEDEEIQTDMIPDDELIFQHVMNGSQI